MNDHASAKTSQAGSLSTTFSEKLKIAGAKTGKGDLKDINVAILKATTNQFHVVPKEKHVRTLKLAVHPSQGRRNALHIISELHRRMQDSTDWLTALKTLITLHRLMRETDSSFMGELVQYSQGLVHGGHGGAGAPVPTSSSRLFGTENFVDRTKGEGRFDFSEWVRAYGKYLDEQLTVYATLKWYVEQEAPGAESRFRSLPPRDLLFQLPHLQRLQRRLLDCVPRGAAMHDPVVLFSLSLVVKESFKVYKAVSEGIINLADAFFEMELHDATRGLEYYKEGIAASDALSGYYATIEQLDEIKRTMQLPKLSTPPSDFLRSMEAYLAEAPRPLPEGDIAAAPAKKGIPLRKGKLLQSKSSGPSSAGTAAISAAPHDPGMVLPVPSTTSAGSAGQEVTSPSSPASAVSSAAAAASAGRQAPLPEADLLVRSQPSTNAAIGSKPSPLDLLSDLDFSFGASPAPVAGAAAGLPPGTVASVSANPFADAPLAPAPAAASTMPMGSSNPFSDSIHSPAAPPNSSDFIWSAAPSPTAQVPTQQVQQPTWPPPPPLQQPLYGQPAYGAPGLASPAGGSHPTVSDDPFAGFGTPSPSAAPTYGGAAAQGAFWRTQPAGTQYGAAGAPQAIAASGDELSKAALNDPFAALTGLPPKSSPAASGSKPSPPRPNFF